MIDNGMQIAADFFALGLTLMTGAWLLARGIRFMRELLG